MVNTIRATTSLTSPLRRGEKGQPAQTTHPLGVQTGSRSLLPPVVYEVLRTPGRPLDPAIRNFFEHHFRCDFSRVRVHIDACATASAHLMNTLAYTSGNHIVFGEGQYAPWMSEGKKLLAHELTHVIQQSQPALLPLECLPMPALGDAFEQEADKCAHLIVTPAAYPYRELNITHKTNGPVFQGWYIDQDHRAPLVKWQTHEFVTRYVLSEQKFASWIHQIFKDLLIRGVGEPDKEKEALEERARRLGQDAASAQKTIACLYHGWGCPEDLIDRHIDRYIYNAAYYFV